MVNHAIGEVGAAMKDHWRQAPFALHEKETTSSTRRRAKTDASLPTYTQEDPRARSLGAVASLASLCPLLPVLDLCLQVGDLRFQLVALLHFLGS